ncbi:putative mitochondrial protein [Tanacetum coccineum]
MAVVAALDKWKGYLIEMHFKIRTNHFSLKYLLDQKLTTPFQLKWLPKLLGFVYEIVYKRGVDNADALSRVNQCTEILQTVMSSVASDVMYKCLWKKGSDGKSTTVKGRIGLLAYNLWQYCLRTNGFLRGMELIRAK